jgi:hypothetical protein
VPAATAPPAAWFLPGNMLVLAAGIGDRELTAGGSGPSSPLAGPAAVRRALDGLAARVAAAGRC